MSVNFTNHLQKQLGFLERSSQSYDEGYIDEAIRISTIIRVLLHDTRSSTSLLNHMNSKEIEVLSTSFEPSPETISFIGMGMMKVGGNECSYYPQLGDGPRKEFISLDTWWNQTVMVLGKAQRISRKKIVLTAANKDGGAHIDTALTEEYSLLSQEGAVGNFIYNTNGIESVQPITDAHLVSLRQMAYEILNSPAILDLLQDS